MERVFFVLGAVLAGVGVIAGAFGAHGLRGRLTPELLGVFETGVRYHLIHALGLLAVAWAMTRWPGAATSTAGWLFLAGIFLFSGSLYGLSLSGLRWLGAITPIGGVAWVVGWLILGWGVWQGR
jgi:uncharacterized membrane protein YgdD (TMEM256/DUF423 family)